MTKNNPALDTYLTRLDRALGAISVSEKAEIVLEIKSHIEDALASGAELSSTIASLGEAETVANRYLLERGLQPQRAPRHPMVKWLTIGFLGTFGIFCLTMLVVLWNFMPLVKVDEQAGRVQILGGLIDIKDSSITKDAKSKREKIRGAQAMKPGQIFELAFSNAALEVLTSESSELQWKCEVTKTPAEPISAAVQGTSVKLNLADLPDADCVIKVPAGVSMIARGSNGSVDVTRPNFNFDAEMANGSIDFELEETREYTFDMSFTNGHVMPQNLKSSTAKDALRLRAKVTNGRITVDEN